MVKEDDRENREVPGPSIWPWGGTLSGSASVSRAGKGLLAIRKIMAHVRMGRTVRVHVTTNQFADQVFPLAQKYPEHIIIVDLREKDRRIEGLSTF